MNFAKIRALETGVTFLNHGSFGACPAAVLEAQRRLVATTSMPTTGASPRRCEPCSQRALLPVDARESPP